jgi:hypothetical protein
LSTVDNEFVTRSPDVDDLTGPVWRPPRPREPDPRVLAADARPVGVLRMPTGRLVVGVRPDLPRTRPFTAPIPPGEYPVTIPVVGDLAAGVRLTVRDAPVAGWEPAARPGDDLRLLPDGETFCYPDEYVERWGTCLPVPTGFVCLLDAAGNREPTLPDGPGPHLVENDGATLVAVGVENVCDRHPVWIGRAADGGVAAVLVDLAALPAADPPGLSVDDVAVGDEVVVVGGAFTTVRTRIDAVDPVDGAVFATVSVFGRNTRTRLRPEWLVRV